MSPQGPWRGPLADFTHEPYQLLCEVPMGDECFLKLLFKLGELEKVY